VAADGDTGRRASFSDRNASVVISAPGVNVVGAGPGGEYLIASGTSPAAAFVSGVVALIRSKYPQLAPALVTQALVSSARHRPAAGYSPATGFGEVDAVAALTAAGRLAAQRPEAGLSASAHFGSGGPGGPGGSGPPGPIQVVHRSYPKIVALGALAGLAALGFLLALTLLVMRMLRRRARRAPEPVAET
jgi:subtilisin family serine protease